MGHKHINSLKGPLPTSPQEHVEQDNISDEVRNQVDGQKTDANATEPVKVTYADAVKGKTESKPVKRVAYSFPLTLKI